MFQHALDRAEQITPSERLIAVVTREHRQEAFQQLDRRTIGALLLQSIHQGTAASILLPLTYVRERDAEATVVVFPSDHFVYPEDRYLAQVRRAASIVDRLPDKVVLLGVVPDRLELEYGWIAGGDPLPGLAEDQVRTVRSLVEKPSAAEADSLLQAGGFWNTRAFAAKVSTLWEIGWKYVPHIMPLFERLGQAIGCPNEALERETIYRKVSTDDFFPILGQAADRLAVLELTAVLWSEWNRPERIAETLRRIDRQPAFPLTCLDRPFIPFARPGAEVRDGLKGLSEDAHALAKRALHQVRSKRKPLAAETAQSATAGIGQPGSGGPSLEGSL